MQRTDKYKKNPIFTMLSEFPKQHIVIAVGLIATLFAFLLTPTKDHSSTPQQNTVELAINLSDTTPAAQPELANSNNASPANSSAAPQATIRTDSNDNSIAAAIDSKDAELLATTATPIAPAFAAPAWHTETVKSGDSLSLIFQRAGLSDRALYEFMNGNSETKQLKRIHPGHQIDFQIEDKQLLGLRYRSSPLVSLNFNRSDKGFSSEKELRQPDIHTAYREATIEDSLFMAGKKAQLDANLIMELANIFGWDIDFALDIRQGDSFKVMFEEHFLEGDKLNNGPIMAAEFTNQGRTYKAVRYVDSSGHSQYYTPEGHTMRKEFLRTPVDFARISSHFNLRRKHPVLNRIRAHKGTDYAAPRGTPIRAAGDGKVILAGKKGGYGNTVIIQHGQTYKTLYAHLNKFRRGVRNGSRVKQGQVIGYVGSTGLATGPHLHYEFYVNGAVRNPVTVKLPKAKSVAKKELNRFMAQTQPLLATLDNFHKETQYAQSTTPLLSAL